MPNSSPSIESIQALGCSSTTSVSPWHHTHRHIDIVYLSGWGWQFCFGLLLSLQHATESLYLLCMVARGRLGWRHRSMATI